MNKRNLFLGLGAGIILSSVVFYIAFLIAFKPVSDDYIISKAKELNMVSADEIPQAQTLSDEDIIAKAKELGMIFETKAENQTNKSEESEIQSTETQIQQQSEVTDETTEIINVRIFPGSSAISVSKTLYEAGVIDNSDDFLTFLKQNNKANTIRAGYFEIPLGSSDKEILEILTTPPKKQTR